MRIIPRCALYTGAHHTRENTVLDLNKSKQGEHVMHVFKFHMSMELWTCVLNIFIYINAYIYIYIYSVSLHKCPQLIQFFYIAVLFLFFYVVYESTLLNYAKMSNFDKCLHNLIMLIQKQNIKIKLLYIHIYIIQQFSLKYVVFESTLLNLRKPLQNWTFQRFARTA